MPVRTPRLTASAVLLTLVLGACSDAAGPTEVQPSTAAASAAQVLTYSAVMEGIVSVPLGDAVSDCLAEPIEVHFRGRLKVTFVQTGGGLRSLSSVHQNDMGSWALGGETGTVYRLVGGSVDQSTDGAGASTWTTWGRQRYVGPGGTAFSVRSSYRLTITPDGTLAAERLSSALECR